MYETLSRWHDAVSGLTPGSAEWENTRLYLYGAGHGYGPCDGTAALLLADASDKALGYHLEIQRYFEWLTLNAPFKEVLLFSDCCRRQYENGPRSYDPPFTAATLTGPVEVFAIAGYAARRNEVALEPKNPTSPDEARGVFTSAVLDGLSGAAANGGVVTSASLATYVRTAVEDRTKKRGVPQKVEFAGDLSQRIEICAPQGPPLLRSVIFSFSPGAFGEAVLRDGSLEIIGRHQVAAGEWSQKLADGFYLLEPGENSGGFRREELTVVGDLRVAA